ncbi:hypothetical protein L6452_08899 [Arctium lappa]|uniref:Uncharacterized protein n=1 Tax=Arctium lappa TaxID=4217 RepID=A0ACB9DIZ3_ARCLA|nr:hypothetical protein L6452_08899 [Arctium lappa]
MKDGIRFFVELNMKVTSNLSHDRSRVISLQVTTVGFAYYPEVCTIPGIRLPRFNDSHQEKGTTVAFSFPLASYKKISNGG